MHISLTSRLERFVKEKVQIGLYNNASEVIREALRLLEQMDQLNALKLQVLRETIQVGINEADCGAFSHRSVNDIVESQTKRRK
jgi:antitoxin ParD1/3/4